MTSTDKIQTYLNDQILWFSSLCLTIVRGFHYINEPKQGGSWSGYIMS